VHDLREFALYVDHNEEGVFPVQHIGLLVCFSEHAEVAKGRGYATAAFGKWHNTPDWETQPNGPFDHWPTGLGFDYWYGFQGGETSQWEPQLYRNTLPVEPHKSPEEGYHLTTDLVDDAIAWIEREQAITPDKPFFVYFAPGAVHAPLHAPRDWIVPLRPWQPYRNGCATAADWW